MNLFRRERGFTRPLLCGRQGSSSRNMAGHHPRGARSRNRFNCGKFVAPSGGCRGTPFGGTRRKDERSRVAEPDCRTRPDHALISPGAVQPRSQRRVRSSLAFRKRALPRAPDAAPPRYRDRREIIGSTRAGRVSSLPFGLVLTTLDRVRASRNSAAWARAGCTNRR